MKYVFVLCLISWTINAAVFGQQIQPKNKRKFTEAELYFENLLKSAVLIDDTSSEESDIVHTKIYTNTDNTNQLYEKNCKSRLAANESNENYLKLIIDCSRKLNAESLTMDAPEKQLPTLVTRLRETELFFRNFVSSFPNTGPSIDTTNSEQSNVAATNFVIDAGFRDQKNGKNYNGIVVMHKAETVKVDCVGEEQSTSNPNRITAQNNFKLNINDLVFAQPANSNKKLILNKSALLLANLLLLSADKGLPLYSINATNSVQVDVANRKILINADLLDREGNKQNCNNTIAIDDSDTTYFYLTIKCVGAATHTARICNQIGLRNLNF